MAQDSFIHETADANIDVPKGENLTVFRREGIARNPIDALAPFHVVHPDGYVEPIASAGGPPASGYQVDINSVVSEAGSVETLTATPSFGLPADYTYSWSLESANNVNVNPTFGGGALNVQDVENLNLEDTAEGLIRVTTTHIATGAIAQAYYWVALAVAPIG